MPLPLLPPAIVEPAVFTGHADLQAPNQGGRFAVFTERCGPRHTVFNVTLTKPYTLQQVARLEIHVSATATAGIRVSAAGGSLTLTAFGNKSQVGCVAAGQQITLDYTPGGKLGGLLIVQGQGTVIAD